MPNGEAKVNGTGARDRRPPPLVILLATVAQVGRVRLSKHELERISVSDKLDVRPQENGDLIVTYLRGD